MDKVHETRRFLIIGTLAFNMIEQAISTISPWR